MDRRDKIISINRFYAVLIFLIFLIFLSVPGIFLPSADALTDTAANTDNYHHKTSSQVESLMVSQEKVPIIIVLKEKPGVRSMIMSEMRAGSKELAINSMKGSASVDQQALADILKDEKGIGKVDEIKQFWIVNAIAVNASPEVISALSNRDDVEMIRYDAKFHLLEDVSIQVSQVQIDSATGAIKHIDAAKAWEIGIDGSGINVSVIDTGINAMHPDIAGRILNGYDFVNHDNYPADDHGHGTHVAGTVGGNGAGGTTTGVAPNVNLLIAKVCDSGGWCLDSNIINAIQWSIDNGTNIISMSLGGGRDTMTTEAVNNAISMGVTVIAAAGNSGPGAGTIEFPGGEKNVIAVGAVDISDNIAGFSSRGSITIDGEVLTKPDVAAPGVYIKSLDYASSGYLSGWSGTSMATPHVSGAAALLLQAAKKSGITLSPAQVKSILENTSVDLGAPGKDNTYGAGRIDVFKAVRSIDTEPPRVIANLVNYPGGNPSARNGDMITINATITDSGLGVKNATVNASSINPSLSNVMLNNISGFWINSSVIVNTSSGSYLLNITSYDNVSNVNNSAQLMVTVDNSPDGPGYINGTVMGSTDKTALSGLVISIEGGNSTTTDAAGFYSFAVIAGTYNLTVVYEPEYYANTTAVLAANNTVSVHDIALVRKPTGNITGSVRG